MPRRITGVTQRLIDTATDEFRSRGFEGASIRSIAARAGTSPRAVYTRFENKEDLFAAVVGPVATEFREMFIKEREDYWQRAENRDFSVPPEEIYLKYIRFAYAHKDIFKILLSGSSGTAYASFTDQIADIEISGLKENLPRLTGKNAELLQDEATWIFVEKITRAFFINLFSTITDDMEEETAREYVIKLTRFYSTGIAMGDGYGLIDR